MLLAGECKTLLTVKIKNGRKKWSTRENHSAIQTLTLNESILLTVRPVYHVCKIACTLTWAV